MLLEKVTVEIDYRFDAGTCIMCTGSGWSGRGECGRCHGTGSEPPSRRALMARVRTQIAGGSFVFGGCLIGPRIVSNVNNAKQLCCSALFSKCLEVVFVVSDRIPGKWN